MPAFRKNLLAAALFACILQEDINFHIHLCLNLKPLIVNQSVCQFLSQSGSWLKSMVFRVLYFFSRWGGYVSKYGVGEMRFIVG
jgi:hypothetical protein